MKNEKDEDEILSFLRKVAANRKFWSQKLKYFLIMKM